jgi:hypothetical protein
VEPQVELQVKPRVEQKKSKLVSKLQLSKLKYQEKQRRLV